MSGKTIVEVAVRLFAVDFARNWTVYDIEY